MPLASLHQSAFALKSLITSTALALVLAVSATSVAQAEEITGIVASVDYEDAIIVLEDGSTLILPEDTDTEAYEPGQMIQATYEMDSDGNLIVLELAIAE
ncbi:DUF1344 domain-containing protein [Roseibium sp. CAU 1637]|uniref:DUF1344 domain-containing protein n=1 Tax=Roseibium limicola TaxID=2816037 RepID=A0A939EJL9_9HYPH|nr:DUF1344 domain-containing protein [Roseibium limicola]MBO0343799.1 DUF1344 domain-containing protein [Roseibium limicola]